MARRGHNHTIMYKRLPKKGTKRREVLIRLLSQDGITSYEAARDGLVTKQNDLKSYLNVLIDEQGWVINAFPVYGDRARPNNSQSKKPYLAMKIVGRIRWDCTYRDYTRWTLP
jgi:hypothetical protein